MLKDLRRVTQITTLSLDCCSPFQPLTGEDSSSTIASSAVLTTLTLIRVDQTHMFVHYIHLLQSMVGGMLGGVEA